MKVLACDGIHEDGRALFRGAGCTVDVSAPIKDPAALIKALDVADALLVRSATSVTAESNDSHLRAPGVNIVNFPLGAKGNGEALAAITVDREVAPAQLVALRAIPGVLELEIL